MGWKKWIACGVMAGGALYGCAFKKQGAGEGGAPQVRVPTVHYIRESLLLERNLEIKADRVVFLPNVEIVTNAYDLAIEADEIVGIQDEQALSPSKTVLSTFRLEDVKPTRDARLLKNGSIFLRARKLVGKFEINLRGMNGVDGRSGEELTPPDAPLRGRDGARGRSAEIEIRSNNCTHEGVVGVDGACVCRKAPENGEDGYPGPDGHDGEAGTDGGGAGAVSLVVDEYSSAHVTLRIRRGDPGRGGLGATGRPGGLGGRAGLDAFGICPPARAGDSGPTGARGRAGANGNLGQLGLVVLPSGTEVQSHFVVISIQ